MLRNFIRVLMASLALPVAGWAQESPAPVPKRTLGVVATAHLDTQWRWTIKNTIEEYILNTLHDNFKLFELYPDYVFSFEGAFRYMKAKEYYPAEWERLKHYVAEGRWRVAGSWVDAVDVNIPSFESLVRHTLYGNGFYKREFGKQSYDIFLPDCFGFGYALPSIAHHCGLKSFSTQKLTWGCSVPVPFSIGEWQGVDGSTILAALNPGDYTTSFTGDLSRDTNYLAQIDSLGNASGCYVGYAYHGTGDVGGGPDSSSVDWLAKSMHSDGPIQVKAIGSDDLAKMIAECPGAKLPRYDGELLMTRHGVGCYTSQSAMKRWNRHNELLADDAERASVLATMQGGFAYPRSTLERAWVRFLWHEFHDDVTGTSIPEAYEYSWSDELLSLNEFSSVLTSAVAALTPALDTRAKGQSYVVYNPLSITRQDVVELPLSAEQKAAAKVQVFGPDGKQVPSQLVTASDGSGRVLFLARVPSLGVAAYDLRSGGSYPQDKGVTATTSTLENDRYKVTLNGAGDVASIYDKAGSREMLAAPIEWQLIFDKPKQWPSWEIQYEDLLAGPRGKVEGKPQIEVLESGAVRGAIRIVREHGNSRYSTTIRLAAGEAGNRIDFVNEVDWAEKETLLKVAFRPSFKSEKITYDLGLGAIARGINTEKKYEVPGRQWADFTAADTSYGLAVLNDCKYGWDHPDSSTLRLTLIHTPGVFDSWNWVGDQSSMDMGHHRFTYSVAAHPKSWQASDVEWQAARLNQPLLAFAAPAHSGKLGKSWSFLQVEGDGKVSVNAVKIAEQSDEVIVRVRELAGRPAQNMKLTFARPVLSAREVNGQEEELGSAAAKGNSLSFSLTAYQPKAFAVRLSPNAGVPRLESQPLNLTYNMDGISNDGGGTDGNLDGAGYTLAGELLPDTLHFRGIRFAMGPTTAGANNMLSCTGQRIELPAAKSDWASLHLLMLATKPAESAIEVEAREGKSTHPVSLYHYAEPMGQWNNRMVNGQMVSDPAEILPSYINQSPVAWAGTHRHTPEGKNDTYKFTYLYDVALDLAPGSTSFVLPNQPEIKLLAASVVGAQHDRVEAAWPLYDEASAALARISASQMVFLDSTRVQLSSPTPGAQVRYTLDGSEPTVQSAVYTEQLQLAQSTTVKARAFGHEGEAGTISTLAVKQLFPKAPVAATKTAPGLTCTYYEGEWFRLPNFDSLAPVAKLVMTEVAIPDTARPEDYGLVFKGFVSVPADGLYEFGISSDDGSALWVADTLVADNDGIHGTGEIAGQVALKAGLHPLVAKMFQRKGGQSLDLFMTGPGLEKQKVGKDRLFH